ncbi:hypothetical protein [Streptomyces sp. AK02-04a]|uniref:hypothetical protein n=1 Tax=Streptomyces sp. AK02-04a TaxID=3028649 RepID=UPI0029AC7364|nr:hypothetical protein [Streptomyces sp. AK02-04a]MDX3763309.1 hypothetical protein [Streptomyces sp. AK02-04a]
METEIGFDELDLLVGEVLPERTVMGSLVLPLGGFGGHDEHAAADGGASSASSSAAGGGAGGGMGGMFGGVFGGNHSDTVQSTCQSIGQGQSTVPSLTCMPATIRSY